ncbi:MAG: PocR ligand-binding domain-containing protein, partial [Thermotaleaceae bacterium]
MKLLDTVNLQDKQKFSWGEISWLHEPIDSPYGRLSVAQVTLYPGCQQEKHYHLGEEQLFYVVQGQGIFITNGEKRDIHEPMVVYIPPHSEHEVLNTGKEDLIFIVAYVPMKLIELQKPYTVAKHRNIQDLIPIEVLQSIKEQLSELLKMTIHICDKNHGLLTRDKEENDFCKICSSIEGCTKRRYASDSTNQLSDKMYRCDYDLIELEIPIHINENIIGYIKSGSFILSNSKDIDKNIYKMGEIAGIDPPLILENYRKIPDIIKSRIYVIQEHLVIAAHFIQVMLERSIMEDELLEKDNEILIRTKEKIELKDALKNAN